MKTYDRLFGSGPTGMISSILLLILAKWLEGKVDAPSLGLSPWLSRYIFLFSGILCAVILAWSVRSLPPEERGRNLCQTGAFKYFRHPLYAAFLSCFNFGLALYLNNLIYLIWAILLHPLWHVVIKREENLMRGQFGEAYEAYCAKTGRFFPRLF